MADLLPKTPAELIDRLKGTGYVAEELNVPDGRVSAWKARGRIPDSYWRDIVALAKKLRVRGVTLEYIYEMHAERVSA